MTRSHAVIVTMLRLIAKFVGHAAVVLWPVILPVVVGFAFVQHLPFKLVADGKTELEPAARAALSLAGLMAAFAYDTYEYYAPRERAERFNKSYVETVVFAEFLANLSAGNVTLGEDVRINALLARRPPTIVPRFFSWLVWDGYSYTQGIHPDQTLRLLGFQGLSAQVLSEKKIRFADLRGRVLRSLSLSQKYLMCNEFRLTWWQLKRTEHLKYVLSVPMLKTVSPKPNLRENVVGVFNIDAVSDRGAAWIEQNQKALGTFLRLHGKVLAELA